MQKEVIRGSFADAVQKKCCTRRHQSLFGILFAFNLQFSRKVSSENPRNNHKKFSNLYKIKVNMYLLKILLLLNIYYFKIRLEPTKRPKTIDQSWYFSRFFGSAVVVF